MTWSFLWNDATRWVATQLNAVCTYLPPPPKLADDPPRKILLLHCHPRSDSMGTAIADAVEAGAMDGGHELRRRGLYEAKFQPVMSAAERAAYFDADGGVSRMPKDIRSAIADLKWCDSLVVVYPTWWFGMPAMLKGYFDRVLIPGDDATWNFPDPGAGALSGLGARLTNIDRIVGISTYGSGSLLFGAVPVAALAGDGGRTTLGMAVRDICTAPGSPCLLHWHALYNMDFTTLPARQAFLEQVRSSIRDL
mmetsp:Transcript_32030/g.90887  ORF Transcript_32030/g.90887 Transcript_32030/m.90887 type:complete len:251 (-) Transcript_32030:199-951(-)